MNAWQFLSGGGEDDEISIQAAKREANEEGGIPYDYDLLKLDSTASIPANNFAAYKEWGDDVYIIPEYSFGVDMKSRDLKLSSEHTEIQWVEYDDAVKLLKWDSNRTALWELKERITKRST
jgi:dATP pyrophosphohydrolase